MMRCSLLLLRFLMLLMLYALPAVAKEYPMLHMTQQEGLPSNTVYDIYQDAASYIWLATENGVSRYNGLKFENFTTSDGLPTNECFFFRNDVYGRLWIGTYSGALVYYKDHQFHTAQNTPFLKLPFPVTNVLDIELAADSSIYFSFVDHHCMVKLKGEQTESVDFGQSAYLQEQAIEFASIKHIQWLKNNYFKIVFSDFDIILDHSLNFVRKELHQHFYSRLVCRDRRYYLSKDSIFLDNYTALQQDNRQLLHDNTINRIVADRQTQFFCTNHGLYFDRSVLLPNATISTLFIDKEQNYWISTIGSGVFKLSKNFRQYQYYTNAYSGTAIFAQAHQKALFYSTTDRDVYKLCQGSIQVVYDFEQEQHTKAKKVKVGNIIIGDTYYNLTEYQSFAIHQLGAKKPLINNFNYEINFNTNSGYLSRGYLYLRGRHYFHYWKIQDHLSFKGRGSAIRSNKILVLDQFNNTCRIHAASYSKDTQLFFSTSIGVYKIQDSLAIAQKQFQEKVFKGFVIAGNYFLGYTEKNAMVLYNNFTTDHMTVDSSILNDCVWDRFYKLNDSTVVISSNDYYRLIELHSANGAPKYSIRILENQYLPLQAENIFFDSTNAYFFKNNAICVVPIVHVLDTVPLPMIRFNRLLSLRSRHPINEVLNTLSYSASRSISIQYDILAFNTDKVICEYAVLKDDDTLEQWIPSDGVSVRLVEIGYGSYTLKLRAKTISGRLSTVQTMHLLIEKPFWLSWWFISLLSLLGLSLLWSIVYYLIRRKAKENERELKFLKSEFRALNALMNPHFIFNSLNSLQGLINRDDRLAASEYVRTISDLIRQNMYNISSDLISLEQEMKLIRNYLKIEKLRFKERLNYSINIDPTLELDLIKIPPLVIQPLVENAIKYGIWKTEAANGYIEINIYEQAQTVCVAVIDNGPGFSAPFLNEVEHQSMALNNLRKRLEQLSRIHQMQLQFFITELLDNEAKVKGVMARIVIAV